MKNSIQRANMKADTLKKQSTYFIQFIKSTILIAGMLMTTLGNHTFATLGIKHSADSNIYAVDRSVSFGDEIGNTKISTPGLRSFYRADREINRNMANEIKQLYSFKFVTPVFSDADQNIHSLFSMEYKIQNLYPNLEIADEKISNEFYAFNINQYINNNTLAADNEMNKNFEKTFFIPVRPNLALADCTVDAQFQLENN